MENSLHELCLKVASEDRSDPFANAGGINAG